MAKDACFTISEKLYGLVSVNLMKIYKN